MSKKTANALILVALLFQLGAWVVLLVQGLKGLVFWPAFGVLLVMGVIEVMLRIYMKHKRGGENA